MYAAQKVPFNCIMEVNVGGFTLIQQNGQRTYGGPPPNWPPSRPAPSRDCEVFIGRLPRMVFEDELIPLFLRAGELYEFRLMLDFSGTNRGYGYAHYATLQGATNAIKTLNKYEILDGHQIGVLRSKNNCRLLFGNIKPGFSKEDFQNFIRAATDNVLEVIMFANYNELKKTAFSISIDVEEAFLSRVPRGDCNSQFAIVEYENHKAAAVARRVLIPKFGHILAIDWAVPPKDRKRNIYDNMNAPNARAIHGVKNENKISGRNSAKPRPVPILMTEPSIMDNVPFMPINFKGVCDYFKYLLRVSLFTSADRMEIPLQICTEIQRKIVDRITNLENCGQAVQLILNYLAWYNEKKPNVANAELQNVFDEVKLYSDAFVNFVLTKIRSNYVPNPIIEEYYMNILPRQLNMIFNFALSAVGEEKMRVSGQITKALQWFGEMARKREEGDVDALIALEKMKALSLSEQPVQNFVAPNHQRTIVPNYSEIMENKENILNRYPGVVQRPIVANGSVYVQRTEENRILNHSFILPKSDPVPILRNVSNLEFNETKSRHSPDSGISVDFATESNFFKINPVLIQ